MTEPRQHNVNESHDKIRLETDKPAYKEKEILYHMYVEEQMTMEEIGTFCGVSKTTISRWIDKHGIQSRDCHSYNDGPWRDEELVNRLYHEEQMSASEIADELGCSVTPIYKRIENVRSTSEAAKIWTWKLPPNIQTTKDGYEVFQTKVHGEKVSFRHHRLIAVAEHGFDAVTDKIVHHNNGVPWDNRPHNLEIMSQSEHVREHFEEIPRYEKAAMWALRETDYTAEEIGEMFGHSRSTVATVWKRIEDGDYPITEANA